MYDKCRELCRRHPLLRRSFFFMLATVPGGSRVAPWWLPGGSSLSINFNANTMGFQIYVLPVCCKCCVIHTEASKRDTDMFRKRVGRFNKITNNKHVGVFFFANLLWVTTQLQHICWCLFVILLQFTLKFQKLYGCMYVFVNCGCVFFVLFERSFILYEKPFTHFIPNMATNTSHLSLCTIY